MKRLIVSAFCVLPFVTGWAQWTVINLHPAGATYSELYDVEDDQQVGRATFGGVQRAALFAGFANTFVDLHPAGTSQSIAWGTGIGKQVGRANTGLPGIWTGTAGSWQGLLPGGATSADCYETDGIQQVGYANFPGSHRASLWSGSAATWIDLSPAGTTYSDAMDVSNGSQCGSVNVGGLPNASLWFGTAASWVNLHPGAPYFRSGARALHSGTQVGDATTTSNVTEAMLWNGSSGTAVSLHPAGATLSSADGVHLGVQVGSAIFAGVRSAGLWRGSAGTWENLHNFLPLRFSESSAQDVWRNAGITYVVGYAFDPALNRREAVMWVSGVSVSPSSFTPFRGVVTGGNLASLLDSDDDRLLVRPGVVFTTAEPPVQIIVNGTSPTGSPIGFTFEVESSASFGNAERTIALFNFITNQYETLETRLATLTDRTSKVTVAGNPSRFVQAGTNAVRARVSFRAAGPSFAYPWQARIDMTAWRFP